MSRKLASVQTVKAIKPIEGADRIEVIQVLNWNCVAKKGEFHVGDKVIYFEIDSLLPDIPMFEWLRGSSWSQKLNKYKIKTHTFRNQISQGLVIPISQIYELLNQVGLYKEKIAIPIQLEYDRGTLGMTEKDFENQDGWDLTEWLKIEKYEPETSNGSLGELIHHEWYVPKTDEERIQVCAEDVLPEYINADKGDWYASIKLDGTSCTAGLFADMFLIGGRNQWYKDDNMYTLTVKRYGDLETKLKDYQKETGLYVVFQGELCGPGIQSNKLGLTQKEWYIFNAFTSATGENGTYTKCDLIQLLDLCYRFNLKTVPILPFEDKFDFSKELTIDETVDALLKYVEDFKYRTYFDDAKFEQLAEGIVFRKNDMSNSFKVVSNKYLLKGGE